MTQLYRPVLDENGEPTGEYEAVEDVFKEDVVEHPKYRKAVSDAYEGRKTVKTLKQQLELQEDDSQVTEQPEENQEQQPASVEAGQEQPSEPQAPAPLDVDTLYETFKQRLTQEQQAEAQAKTAHQEMVSRIGRENNVNPALLRGSTEQELTQHAQQIAKEQLKFRDIGASPQGQVTLDDDFWSRVDSQIGLGSE